MTRSAPFANPAGLRRHDDRPATPGTARSLIGYAVVVLLAVGFVVFEARSLANQSAVAAQASIPTAVAPLANAVQRAKQAAGAAPSLVTQGLRRLERR